MRIGALPLLPLLPPISRLNLGYVLNKHWHARLSMPLPIYIFSVDLRLLFYSLSFVLTIKSSLYTNLCPCLLACPCLSLGVRT
jgi:hypothetical protein